MYRLEQIPDRTEVTVASAKLERDGKYHGVTVLQTKFP